MKHHLVREDYEYLKKDIQNKEQKLKELSKDLGVAARKSSSFPSNNPEYVAVLDQIHALQANVDSQNEFLENTNVIPFEKIDENKVDVYSLVTAENKETGEEYKYYIHYPNIFQKDLSSGGILVASPLGPVGLALVGHKVGEEVTVELPGRKLSLKITEVKKIKL